MHRLWAQFGHCRWPTKLELALFVKRDAFAARGTAFVLLISANTLNTNREKWFSGAKQTFCEWQEIDSPWRGGPQAIRWVGCVALGGSESLIILSPLLHFQPIKFGIIEII